MLTLVIGVGFYSFGCKVFADTSETDKVLARVFYLSILKGGQYLTINHGISMIFQK